jgi:hypothetical protein
MKRAGGIAIFAVAAADVTVDHRDCDQDTAEIKAIATQHGCPLDFSIHFRAVGYFWIQFTTCRDHVPLAIKY